MGCPFTGQISNGVFVFLLMYGFDFQMVFRLDKWQTEDIEVYVIFQLFQLIKFSLGMDFKQ